MKTFSNAILHDITHSRDFWFYLGTQPLSISPPTSLEADLTPSFRGSPDWFEGEMSLLQWLAQKGFCDFGQGQWAVRRGLLSTSSKICPHASERLYRNFILSRLLEENEQSIALDWYWQPPFGGKEPESLILLMDQPGPKPALTLDLILSVSIHFFFFLIVQASLSLPSC